MPQTTAPKKKAWKPAFIERLRECANVSRAAKDAGINRRTAQRERLNSETFREAWDDAMEEAIDALEEEARRRAFEGVNEPVYYQGEQVGTVRKYSDTLTIFLLKGRRPEIYGDRVKQEVSGPGGAPVTVRVVYDD
jgi:hypothetical protein